MTAGFWLGAAALAGIVVWMLLPSLLGRRAAASTTAAPVEAGVNLAVLRQQRAQLDADLAAGTLGADQHRAALEEIERRVLDEEGASPARSAAPANGRATSSARSAWAVGIAVPVLAAGLYLKLGEPKGLVPAIDPVAAAASGSQQITAADVQAMVEKLEKRMAERPDDLQGWLMLARSQAALQRYDEASRAYARAAKLAPQDAQLLADQADALAMAQGGTALGEPTTLIERALQLDPDNLKALALAGTAALERSDHAAAVRYWSRASERVPPDSELGKGLAEGLKEARAKLGGAGPGPTAAAQPAPAIVAQAGATAAAGPAASAPAGPATNAAAPGTAQISGRASLSPAAAARVAPTDTVFIVARAANGPRMPLAVLRKQASELPIRFTLDDSMAMAPQMKLSAFPQVVVIVRVSKTGSANPSPDDLVVQSAPVALGARDIELVIERPAP